MPNPFQGAGPVAADFGELAPGPRFASLGRLGECPPDQLARRGLDYNVLAEIHRYTAEPPPNGRIFDKALQITATAGATTEIVAFALPSGLVGVLRFFANMANPSDFPFLSFTLRLNEAPVTGYTNIIGPKAPAITCPEALLVPLYAGARVSVTVVNSAVFDIANVSARLRGWFWSPGARLEG